MGVLVFNYTLLSGAGPWCGGYLLYLGHDCTFGLAEVLQPIELLYNKGILVVFSLNSSALAEPLIKYRIIESQNGLGP